MNKKNVLRFAIYFFIAFLLVVINLNDLGLINNDANVSQFVINNQVSLLTTTCSVLSVIFEPIYVILFVLLVSFLLWIKKYKNEALFLIFVSGFAGAAIYLLKYFFVRTRPALQFLQETGYSFPSGHALISVVLFGSLIYFSFRIKSILAKTVLIILSYFGIFVLGLSRVYLNVHWFSDILGSYFLGASILFTGIYLYKINIFQKLINRFCPK